MNKTLDIDRYTESDHDLDPQKESTKSFYMQIFTEYSVGNLTQKELAEKHKINYNHVNRIIKWAVNQLGETDHSVYLAASLEFVNNQIKDVTKLLEECGNVKEKLKVHAEKRLLVDLRAKLQGLLKTNIETGDKTINVLFPSFKMKDEAKVIEGESDVDQEIH